MTARPAPILVADDNDDDVVLLQRALRSADAAMTLEVVRDGDEAVSYLAGVGAYADRDRFPLPCLLILDLNMPRRSGLEVLAWARRQPGLEWLRIVMFTASDVRADIERARELGADGYFIKQTATAAIVAYMRAEGVDRTSFARWPEGEP